MPFIPLEVYANQASATVSAGGTTAPAGGTVETWTVSSSAAFPVIDYGATQFHVADPAVPSEIVTVQAVSGTTWTVERGAETTIPVAHAAGFTVVQVVTAAALTAAQSPAWQFPVQAYGAQGDGKIGTGGTGTSGTSTFTDAGASFVAGTAPAGDVGKVIIINQGPGGTTPTNPFAGTITAVNSATSVTLSANLAANCASAPYIYGTDDAAAITAAVTAAAQWAVSTGNYKAQVIFEPQNYMLGALTRTTAKQWSPYNTGANYTYNTHIPVPFATQYDRKLVLDFVGTGDASQPFFWGATVPGLAGTCLVSAVWPASQPDATYGQMSVIGTPSVQTNIGTGGIVPFANVLVNVDGISAVMPYNGQQYGFDFRWASAANIDRASAAAFAPVNYAAQTRGGPWLSGPGALPGNGVGCGLAMPLQGSNGNANIGYYAAEGLYIGLIISEYFTGQRVSTMYCHTGIQIDLGVPYPAMHGGSLLFWICEGTYRGLYCGLGAGGQYPLFIGNADFEAMVWNYVDDPDGGLTGVMYWFDLSQTSLITPQNNVGAYNYTIINTRLFPGPWAADATRSLPGPPTAPGSGVAQQNSAFRDATVYASAGTSITGVSVGKTAATLVALGLAAGAGAVTSFRVPSGHWYSVTYSGSLTTKWVLE